MRGFPRSFERAVEIVLLNGRAAVEAAEDRGALLPGVAFIAIGGFIGAVGHLFLRPGIRAMDGGLYLLVAQPIAVLVAFFLLASLLHLVAVRFFGGRGDLRGFLQAQALAAILGWVTVVPGLGVCAELWRLPVSVVILEHVCLLTRRQAIAAVAVFLGSLLVIGALLMGTFGAFLFGPF